MVKKSAGVARQPANLRAKVNKKSGVVQGVIHNYTVKMGENSREPGSCGLSLYFVSCLRRTGLLLYLFSPPRYKVHVAYTHGDLQR